MKVFLKIFLFGVVLFLVTGCSGKSRSPFEKGTFKLTVLHTNDYHGHPTSFNAYGDGLALGEKGQGGLAARSTLINMVRDEVDNVLLLDAGDILSGLIESNLNKGEIDYAAYGYMNYDAIAIGNHEFDYGFDHLTVTLKNLVPNTAFLGSNIYFVEETNKTPIGGDVPLNDRQLIFDEYLIREYNGVRVGIFTVVKPSIVTTTKLENVVNVEVGDPFAVAVRTVKKLREEEKVDVVIALTHLGYYADRSQFTEDADQRSWGDEDLAKIVNGIDLIVGSDTHTLIEEPVKIKNTWVVQAGEWGKYLGRVDMVFKRGNLTEVNGSIIPINVTNANGEYEVSNLFPYEYPITEDQEIINIIKPFVERVEVIKNEKIGVLRGNFEFEKAISRSDDIPVANFVVDAFKEVLGVDIVLQNAGGLRAGMREGDVTRGDIIGIVPFSNTMWILDVPATVIVEAVVHGASNHGGGSFLQASGLRWDLIVKPALRDFTVNNIRFADGRPFEITDADGKTKIYRVAANSFMVDGGDNYRMLTPYKDNGYNTNKIYADVVMEFVQNHGSINVEDYNDNRINVIIR